MDKDAIIEKVYYDPAGYSSIKETLKDANAIDASITYDDVKNGNMLILKLKDN